MEPSAKNRPRASNIELRPSGEIGLQNARFLKRCCRFLSSAQLSEGCGGAGVSKYMPSFIITSARSAAHCAATPAQSIEKVIATTDSNDSTILRNGNTGDPPNSVG
jgi:hypothetical protein